MTDLQTNLEKIKKDLQNQNGKIKQIPFSMYAKGEGIVNFNGNTYGLGNVFRNSDNPELKNYQLPKLENAPTTKIYEDNIGKSFNDCRFLVSSNCFKHEMFKEEAFGLNNVEDATTWLLTSKGLLNGFVIAVKGGNSHRTSPVFLSELLTSFVDNEKENIIKKLENYGFTEMHKENNGKLKVEYRKQDTRETEVSFTKQMLGLLSTNFYKASGVIDLDKLSFIPVGGEVGRDNIAKINEKNVEMLVSSLILSLNNMKEEVVLSKFLMNDTFSNLLKFVKENEVNVEAGIYRRYGNLAQLHDSKLAESGLLLNKTAVCVLILKYFDLMLKTKMFKTHGSLETIFVNVDLSDIDFASFYERISDFKVVKKEEDDKTDEDENNKTKSKSKGKNKKTSSETDEEA